jgi:hypothetical protein
MPPVDKYLVLPLNEGVVEETVSENSGGILLRSENTRLTKLFGTVSRRPAEEEIDETQTNAVCGGIINGGRGSLAAYFKPAVGSRRICGTSMELLKSPVTALPGQNAYFPYPMVESGALGGAQTFNTPATAFDSANRQWFLSVRLQDPNSGVFGVFVTVVEDGADVISSQLVTTLVTALPNGLTLWCGLTPSNDDMIVWYAQDSGIYARRVIFANDINLSIGAASLIANPSKPALIAHADVVSDGANVGWLICRQNGTFFNSSIFRINLTTLAITSSLQLTGSTTNNVFPVYFSLCYRVISGTGYVGYYVSDRNVFGTLGVLNGTTMANLWSSFTTFEYGACSVQPWSQNGSEWMLFAADIYTTTPTTSPTQVSFRRFTTLAGASAGTAAVHWYNMQSRGAAHVVSSAEVYPYIPLFPVWSTFSAGAFPIPDPTTIFQTPSELVIDPSVELFTPLTYGSGGSDFLMTPVGRFAVDRISNFSTVHNSNPSAISPDGRLGMTYNEFRFDQSYAQQNGYMARYVVLDLAPATQPGVAYDTGSVSAIGASLVASWDGIDTTELAFLHRPRVFVQATGGTGSNLTGVYAVTAVITFRDAGGNIHRSAPALPFPITLAGTAPRVFVTMPTTMRSGELQEEFDIVLYWTLAGGTIFYAQSAYVTDKGANGGMWRFDLIYTPNAQDTQLYSTGAGNEALLPECPPPALDIKSIGGRFWLIDAENPYSVMPSKLKEQGISVEFNGNLRINGFDPQFGKLVAVVDGGGKPLFFAERGVWQVDGYGPDNNGKGGSFGDPRLVSNQGCTNRDSIVQIPGVGVLFQASDGKFALLGGEKFEQIASYEVKAPTIHRDENEVVYPLADGTGWVVYNWVSKAWTHWPETGASPVSLTSTVFSDDRSRTYVFRPGTGIVSYIDSDSIDTTAEQSIVLERGWIAPGETPHGDCVIKEIWVHSLYSGVHSLTVTVAMDYDENNVITKSWTDVELQACLEDGKYTVGVGLHYKHARAVKVTVTGTGDDTSAEMFQPLTLTVAYGVNPGQMRRVFKQSVALK